MSYFCVTLASLFANSVSCSALQSCLTIEEIGPMMEPVDLVLLFAGLVVFFPLHTATGGINRPWPLVIVADPPPPSGKNRLHKMSEDGDVEHHVSKTELRTESSLSGQSQVKQEGPCLEEPVRGQHGSSSASTKHFWHFCSILLLKWACESTAVSLSQKTVSFLASYKHRKCKIVSLWEKVKWN